MHPLSSLLPSASVSAADHAPPPTCVGLGRVLVALTPIETAEFFPGDSLDQLGHLAAHVRHLDASALTQTEWHARLHAENPEVLIACWLTPPLPAELPPSLRYVCYLAGSIRHLVTREHIAAGLLVSNWGGSISRVIAEWALFHTLSCLRRATHWTLAMHTEGAWKQRTTETASLFGRRVGIHGFGKVARELVRLLQPFGATIHTFAPDVDAATERAWGVRRAATLDSLFADNDVVIELAPLIPETAGVVTVRQLRLLRPGSVFVNVGRGAVVDQDALLKIAREGKVQIGLDVFATEPLPADSPFRGLRNVSLTPHLAGPTTDRRRDSGALALRNLAAYAAGQPLEAQITPAIYDTST